MVFEKIKAEALKLPPEFRASLARELLESLDAMSEEEVERLWMEEAIRRDNEIDQGIARTCSVDDVFVRARARRR